MQKFIALYLAPAAVLADWMSTPEAERKAAEETMRTEWDAWMAQHEAQILETAGAGATKRVTKDGVEDVKNDVMMYSLLEAESADAAAAMFVHHPHLGIPEATIEIMAANVLPGAK